MLLSSSNTLNPAVAIGWPLFSEEGIKISTRAYFQQNKNDYPFQDLYGQTQHLQNAALNQQGFSQDVQLGDEKNNKMFTNIILGCEEQEKEKIEKEIINKKIQKEIASGKYSIK
mgnify:CR=1 FL=1